MMKRRWVLGLVIIAALAGAAVVLDPTRVLIAHILGESFYRVRPPHRVGRHSARRKTPGHRPRANSRGRAGAPPPGSGRPGSKKGGATGKAGPPAGGR